MAAVFYLAVCVLAGTCLMNVLMDRTGTEHGAVNRIWIMAAGSWASGLLIVTWGVYFAAWLLHVSGGVKQPLGIASGICGGIVLLLYGVFLLLRRRKGRKKAARPLVCDRKLFIRETACYLVLMIVILYTMALVFHRTGDKLYSGYTVFSDYAPHTSMIRSFSVSANYPTQYPHFGGMDVRYHFMFQFLTGNLEYLGLPIDVAYNLISAVSLWGFLVFLTQLTLRLSGKAATLILVPVLFFFRSGTTFFRFCLEHIRQGDLLQTLAENTTFPGYTANENWGLWNYNVYLNQRHLGFGLLIMMIAIWLYMDHLEASCRKEEAGVQWIRGSLFSAAAWVPRSPDKALLLGMLIGLCSFWNGAAVIGGLLILMGMAAFSEGKLDFAMTAAAAVVFSMLETRIFIRGGMFSPAFFWGFLSEDKSLPGVLWYLIQISGITITGALLLWIWLTRLQRVMLAAFVIPTVFALTVSLTPDINVNHKYIIMSMAFLPVLWSIVLEKLLRRGILMKALSGLLILLLTATGIYDFVVILKDSDMHHRVPVSLESPVTEWLIENLDETDLILTPEYSMNEVTLSGCMMYLGWPYYAWSAGYDTYYRADKAQVIYSTEYEDVLRQLIREEEIDYILFEEGMTFEEQECDDALIASLYPEVFRSGDGKMRIYRTKEGEEALP